MKYIIVILSIVTFSCDTKTGKNENGVNILVTDKEDTLSLFYYPYYENYSFRNKNDLDSAIFDKTAQLRLPGEFLLGIIEKDRFLNRYLTFRGDKNSNFEDFKNPKKFFLHEEYGLDNYEVVVYNEYIDSTVSPISMHQMLVAVKPESRDTILFQELNIGQGPDYVAYSMITYETWEDRDEMYELLIDAMRKINESNSAKIDLSGQ